MAILVKSSKLVKKKKKTHKPSNPKFFIATRRFPGLLLEIEEPLALGMSLKNWPQGIGRAGQGRDKGDCCGSLADVIRGIPKGSCAPNIPLPQSGVLPLEFLHLQVTMWEWRSGIPIRRDLCKMQTLEKDEVSPC